jgi:hypothetical protein
MCHDGTNVSVPTASIAADLALGYLLDTCGFAGARFAANNTEQVTSVTSDASIRVYPNPANGLVNVVIPALITEAEISITDLAGRNLEQKSVTGNTGEPVQFNLSNYASGMYLVQVKTNDNNYVVKLVVR